MSSDAANLERLIAATETATLARPPGSEIKPARFSIGLRPEQSPQDVGAAVVGGLTSFDPVVAALSELDDRTLIVTLRNRVFVQESERMFEAAYAMADTFALDFAEPEVLTRVMPVPDPARRGPATESIDDFLPDAGLRRLPTLTGSDSERSRRFSY